MANTMLIRTRHAQCKAKVAVIFRVFFFFAIPSFHFLFLTETTELHNRAAGKTLRNFLNKYISIYTNIFYIHIF